MLAVLIMCIFFFSSRRRHTRLTCDWSSDVCSSDLAGAECLVGEPLGVADVDDEPAGRGGGAACLRLLEPRFRSGEGRVGEEGRSWGGAGHLKKKKEMGVVERGWGRGIERVIG